MPEDEMQKATPTERVALDLVKSDSPEWSEERLRHLLDRPLRNPMLERIEERRRELAALPPMELHASYAGTNEKAGQPFVTPKAISLPRRYGRILYSIAADLRPRLTLEAGAGLGISGMYLGAGVALTKTGAFMSFEIADYHTLARDSIQVALPRAVIHQDDFGNFHRYLAPHARIDLCFLDSKHDIDTVIRNYKCLLGWIAPKGVILIDDIGSTTESRLAWDHIVERDDFGFAACVQGRIGFLAR
jgi:predicted O-methyltransferase YrrM